MGGLGLVHWAIVAIVALLLFGRGRLGAVLGDAGKGLGTLHRELARETQESHLPRPADLLSVSPDADRFRR